MLSFSTPAIVLRRVDFGDYDLILTFFTLSKGKISVIAKSAKKSTKRFAGILELFSVLNIVCNTGQRKGLPVLSEAVIKHPFAGIRSDIIKTAYASYWAELINEWMEEHQRQDQVYRLFEYVLNALDLGLKPEAALSIIFQMRFMAISGLWPNIHYCNICRTAIDQTQTDSFDFDFKRGGLACNGCKPVKTANIPLAKGTIKQLLWIKNGELAKVTRIKFTAQSIQEGLKFLEAFVPYHLGKEPRSLMFLKQIRK